MILKVKKIHLNVRRSKNLEDLSNYGDDPLRTKISLMMKGTIVQNKLKCLLTCLSKNKQWSGQSSKQMTCWLKIPLKSLITDASWKAKWKAKCFKVPNIAKGTTYPPCKKNKVIPKTLVVLDISKAVQPKANKRPRNGGLLMHIEKSSCPKMTYQVCLRWMTITYP